MKIGIMQPYFLPYIGYWQLMNAVDRYVVYDDVNFIKGGWINRNRILIHGAPAYLNLPMLGASPNLLIKEIRVNPDPRLAGKSLRTIRDAYAKAPYFSEVYPLMERILTCGETSLSQFILNSFRVLTPYLGIGTELLLSSELEKDCSLRAQEKVISICTLLGGTEYYNAIGGQELYSREDFERSGLSLHFLKTRPVEYPQFGGEFQSNLSILDVMMFNSKEQIAQLLQQYDLV